MNAMNKREMLTYNGGIGYYGAKFTCRICGKTRRFWDWGTLFWDKDTCQVVYESAHYNPYCSYTH